MAICLIEDCNKTSVCRKMCHMHYSRLMRNGDPTLAPKARAPLEERFWRFVAKGRDDECWEWQGHLNMNGYGHIGVSYGKMRGAHRASYEIHNGAIPKGKIVRHQCDNPRCVNPSHLTLGTQKDNVADMISRGRGNWRSLKGEKSPTAVLTAEQAREIKFSDEMGTALAARFGISQSTISAIRRGRLWKHLT